MSSTKARGQEFTLQSGTRKFKVQVFSAVTPEEILVWMSKAILFEKVTGEDSRMGALSRGVKDQMIKSNVSG